jgi:hypothetical protein
MNNTFKPIFLWVHDSCQKLTKRHVCKDMLVSRAYVGPQGKTQSHVKHTSLGQGLNIAIDPQKQKYVLQKAKPLRVKC